jgi:RNA polymerase sigma factor (TIGR02999 family)
LTPMSDVTRILTAIEAGDPQAAKQLLPLVYDELRKLAAQRLAQEKPGQTLQATALVHEAYLRLMKDGHGDKPRDSQEFANRGHFFAAAAEAMRRILVENARRKGRVKHGGQLRRVDLEDIQVSEEMPVDSIVALDEALTRLAQLDSQVAQLVNLHCFAGLAIEQAAEALGISSRTAYRDWAFAQAWLYREIRDADASEEK